jgi:hypothetical protein
MSDLLRVTAMRKQCIPVDVPVPHLHLIITTHTKSNDMPYSRVVFEQELFEWFEERKLIRAKEHSLIWTQPDNQYDYGTDLRIKAQREPGRRDPWDREATHVRFWFRDKQVAMMFKLTWM